MQVRAEYCVRARLRASTHTHTHTHSLTYTPAHLFTRHVQICAVMCSTSPHAPQTIARTSTPMMAATCARRTTGIPPEIWEGGRPFDHRQQHGEGELVEGNHSWILELRDTRTLACWLRNAVPGGISTGRAKGEEVPSGATTAPRAAGPRMYSAAGIRLPRAIP
jgi:hypothetical protein